MRVVTSILLAHWVQLIEMCETQGIAIESASEVEAVLKALVAGYPTNIATLQEDGTYLTDTDKHVVRRAGISKSRSGVAFGGPDVVFGAGFALICPCILCWETAFESGDQHKNKSPPPPRLRCGSTRRRC